MTPRITLRTRLVRASLVAMFVIAFASSVFAQEDEAGAKFDPASTYEQIVADYQRIAANNDRVARAAAGRLISFAYRNVIDRAKELENLNADDLYALGACHEGLGQLDDARELFGKSLALDARPRTHLAIVRVHLNNDLALADKHFAAAVDIDAGYSSLHQFRLVLANAHAARRNWTDAADYLDRYRDYTKSLADSQPGNQSIVATHKAVENRLATLRRMADMIGKAAPPLQAEHWVQGDAVELEKLQGKIVLVDFCAMWAPPSRARMERLKKLHAKYAPGGLEVIGVTLAYGHAYDPEKDQVDVDAERAPIDERADFAAFAAKNKINYRLAVVERATTTEFGVTSLPHTLLLDKQGKVKMILQAGGQEDEAELEATIRELLE